ncbi:MAG: hypothetical protein WC180_03495 [Candidatus Paceibacterota bacterium]
MSYYLYMSLKAKMLLAAGSLAGFVGNALAASNESISLIPDSSQGMENLGTLPYIEKLKWVMDTTYAIVPVVALIALAFLAVKFYFGGWDSVENELKSRRAFFSIIIIVLALKVGAAFIGFVTEW